MVICLVRGADLHMAQLMPLPLTVSCFSKIQISFTYLVPAHLGSTRKWPLNRCVCVLYPIPVPHLLLFPPFSFLPPLLPFLFPSLPPLPYSPVSLPSPFPYPPHSAKDQQCYINSFPDITHTYIHTYIMLVSHELCNRSADDSAIFAPTSKQHLSDTTRFICINFANSDCNNS